MCLSSQEDDIDGIHIVAFAEEEDPGKSSFQESKEKKKHWTHSVIQELIVQS